MIAAAAVAALLSSSRADADSLLERGVELVTQAENARAIRVLRRALLRPASPAERARGHLYLGIARFNLLQTAAARRSFRTALELEPGIELPPDAAPKLRRFFARLRPPATVAPPAAAPATAPPRAPPASAPRAGRQPGDRRSLPAPLEPRETLRPARSARYAPAWLCLGLTVAATAAGVGLGAAASAENRAAEDPALTSNAADEHHRSAARYATGANVLFGVTGAAAVAGGVLLYLGWRRGQRAAAVSFSLPRGGGALVEIDAARW
jgi:tetratricopeptide (TPR) repeat protein